MNPPRIPVSTAEAVVQGIRENVDAVVTRALDDVIDIRKVTEIPRQEVGEGPAMVLVNGSWPYRFPS